MELTVPYNANNIDFRFCYVIFKTSVHINKWQAYRNVNDNTGPCNMNTSFKDIHTMGHVFSEQSRRVRDS